MLEIQVDTDGGKVSDFQSGWRKGRGSSDILWNAPKDVSRE
jgi:hypothetical protein